jgi:muramoyltetrapeptide carboxypeptidase
MKPTQYLKLNDEIRIIAPSSSRRNNQKQRYIRAQERLESLGYKVTFGENLGNTLHLGTARAEERAKDFNAAYADKNVKAIMTLHGGWAANEILPLIDWELVKDNPKRLIGFSDITVLLNAIYAKTGNVNYLGPNFASLGYDRSWQYTLNSLSEALSGNYHDMKHSRLWGVWNERKGHQTKPWKVLQPGKAEAILLGGNAGTFYLLQGTEYQPSFKEDFVLAFEDDDEAGKYTAREFSRRLESLLQLPNVRKSLKGLIVGRFQPTSKVTQGELESILLNKKLDGIPIVTGVDFGHTLPMLTLPIGGKILLDAQGSNLTVRMSDQQSIFSLMLDRNR